MDVKSVWPRFLCALLCACLIALCLLFVPFASAQAHATLPHDGPTMQVSAGFSSRYRDGDWVPLHIILRNGGPDFTGTISVNFQKIALNSVSQSASRYQQAISLPNGAQKQITMYVPVSLGTQGSTQTLTVDLLDSNGNRVTSQATTLRSLGTNDMLVGVLSDQPSGFSALGQVSQPNQTASVYEEPLDATSMPDNAAALQNFDLIVMDDFTTSSLSNDQLAALDNWVSQGGSLVIAGGPEWRRTLTGLPDNIAPVNVTGTSVLPTGTDLLPLGGPGRDGPGAQNTSDAAPAAFPVSDATPGANSTVLQAAGQVPLIVEAQHNQGYVYYLAFDPSLTPLANWSNATNLWQGLLIRAVGDRFLDASQNSNTYSSVNTPPIGSSSGGDWQSVLQTLFPNVFPAMWLILTLLIGYVVILGPLRLVIIRIAKKRTWSWRIVLATIALFSVLSYSLATLQKGTSIVGSSISIMQLGAVNNNVSNTHVTTYIGVFVPNQGNYVIHLPANNLVQQFSNANGIYQGGAGSYAPSQSVISSTSNGIDANLQGVNIWTLQSLASSYDTQLKGGIISHLQIQNNMLDGTVTNSLPYALDDAYILIGQQPISLGNLNAGQTRQISIPFYGDIASPNNSSLADQIATSHGLPVPYIPQMTGTTNLQNDYERHAAVLTTMSGEDSMSCGNGAPCYQPMLTSGTAGKFVVNGRALLTTSGQDPLLLPNAPATFIGWIANNANAANPVVVNGSSVHGTQESLVQAPLDISLSGGVSLPASFINGQLTDAQTQSSNIQMQFPGVYTLSTGSLTFEFASPALHNMDTNTLTFTENTNLVNSLSNAAGGSINTNLNTPGDFSHVQIYLYNWQTHQWDQVSFNQSTLIVNNAQAYTSPDGRILMQFSNQDSTQGTTLLTKPALQLQGEVSR